ncbi:MaoC family dehydratase [Hominifimenecus sp. rT4P-3]|uniref:MaoC family dehydratase n=1 Tax=Hominifimenecus sp. rT4P-3 TaxID=3242979 RepID=UPI003DA6226C
MGAKRYFEEFQIGESVTSRSRQICDGDVRLFGGCTNLNYPIYSDAIYCAALPGIEKPVVPGALVLNVVDTFFAESVSPDGVPTLHYGYDRVEYKKMVYPGECVYSYFEVIGKEEKNEEYGLLIFRVDTYNQKKELVMTHIDKLYVGRQEV